jgi:hypothetical protein
MTKNVGYKIHEVGWKIHEYVRKEISRPVYEQIKKNVWYSVRPQVYFQISFNTKISLFDYIRSIK